MARIATKRQQERKGAARPRGETRDQVRALFEEGLTNGEIARRLGISSAAVSFHARRLGIPPSKKYRPRNDWDQIQAYYDQGNGVRACQEKFGFSRRSWNQAVERGVIRPRPQAIDLERLLVAGRSRNRGHLKRRLVSGGLRENRCEECGLSEWQGEALSMQLHHVNGDGDDNRLENLRLLCPNCHSQTENFARRSQSRRRAA